MTVASEIKAVGLLTPASRGAATAFGTTFVAPKGTKWHVIFAIQPTVTASGTGVETTTELYNSTASAVVASVQGGVAANSTGVLSADGVPLGVIDATAAAQTVQCRNQTGTVEAGAIFVLEQAY